MSTRSWRAYWSLSPWIFPQDLAILLEFLQFLAMGKALLVLAAALVSFPNCLPPPSSRLWPHLCTPFRQHQLCWTPQQPVIRLFCRFQMWLLLAVDLKNWPLVSYSPWRSRWWLQSLFNKMFNFSFIMVVSLQRHSGIMDIWESTTRKQSSIPIDLDFRCFLATNARSSNLDVQPHAQKPSFDFRIIAIRPSSSTI